VILAAFEPAGIDSLAPAVEVLAQFELFVEPLLMEAATGETPDLSRFAFRAAQNGACIVITATHEERFARGLAAACQVPTIRVPLAGDASAAAGLAVLTEGLAGAETDPAGPESGSFATVALGAAGAKNAALLAISILALRDERLRGAWHAFRAAQTQAVLSQPPPGE
jgi:5-(carboxyamino)imidazole ribonucleotide mutase